MLGRLQLAASFQRLRKRALVGVAATTGLTLMAAFAGTPSYAEVPSAIPNPEQLDVASAVAAAKQTGEQVKITAATSETAEFYATPDGEVTGRISAGPVRFRRDGAWVPIDLTLRRQTDGSVAPVAYPESLRISGARAAASGDLASMGTGTEKVTVGWQGALPEPRLAGSTATYTDVRPGVDLVVQATPTGFEQFAILKSAAAAKYATEISLPMTGAGVSSVTEDSQGRLSIRGAGGHERIRIPTPMMWDARSVARGGPPKRRQVTVGVTNPNNAAPTKGATVTDPVTLKLTPDQRWLTSPDTVYPVTIDPYYDWSTTVQSTTVVKGYPTGWPDSDSLFVGTYDDTWTARSFVTWWATGIQGLQVDKATLHFSNPYSTSCSPTPWEIWTTDPITETTSWDNQPAWLNREATSTDTTCDAGWVTADATSFFQNAVDKRVGTPTMGIRAADETNRSQYKQFSSYNNADTSQYPYVEVWYGPMDLGQPLTADETDLFRRQQQLQDFATWMNGEPGFATSGYITSVDDAATMSTTLLWYGNDSALKASILAEAARRGSINVTIKQRAHSAQALTNAANTAIASSGTGAFAGFTVYTAAAIDPNFDGIVVSGQPAVGTTPTNATVAAQATTALGLPVKVEAGTPPIMMAATRGNDTRPFNAGGYMAASNGSKCSTGFAVRVPGTTVSTTARHCGGSDYKPRDRSLFNNDTYGVSGGATSDGAARRLSGQGSTLMFDGGVNGSSKQTVAGYGDVRLGSKVCTSGGNSGVHCGITVTRLGVMQSDGHGTVSMILGHRDNFQIAAMNGDSGGPVWQPSGTAGRVLAVGMIQGGGNGAAPNKGMLSNCGTVRDQTGGCSDWVWFTSMRTIVRSISGGSLVTG